MLMAVAAHPGPWHDGSAPAWWPVFPITFGLFWVAVLVCAVYLLRRRFAMQPAATPARSADPTANARTMLAERFARGEIDEDEYYTRLSVLQQGG